VVLRAASEQLAPGVRIQQTVIFETSAGLAEVGDQACWEPVSTVNVSDRSRPTDSDTPLGHGLARRVEVSIEVDEKDRGRGRGAGLGPGSAGDRGAWRGVFAQVSPGNVASLRCFLAAGYRPAGAKVLFLRTARRRLDNWPAAAALEGLRLALEPLAVSHAEEMAPLLDSPSCTSSSAGNR